MTDANGGSINLRLSLQGAEQVRAALASLGPSGQRAMREIDRSMREAGVGLKALNAASNEARVGLDALASRAGAAGGMLRALGPWGLAAAAALAVLSLGATKALAVSREAMVLAGQLTDAAEKIHVSTDALQEWRHVAIETGADASAADTAIAGFTRRLGEATSGLSKRGMRPFEALGFTREELQQFKSVEDALAEVTKRIASLSSEAERAAVTEKLGLEPLQNALRRPGDEIEGLRQQAHALGVVMDAELIRRADQADKKFDQLSRVIDIQLKSAFVDLAPAIVRAIGLIAQLATALADVVDGWRRVEDRTNKGLEAERARIRSESIGMMLQYGDRASMEGQFLRAQRIEGGLYSPNPRDRSGRPLPAGYVAAGEHYDNLQSQYERLQGLQSSRNEASRPPTPPPGVSLTPPSSGGGGGGKSDADREEARRRREAERALERLASEDVMAQRDRIRALGELAGTDAARAAMAEDLLALDQAQREQALAELEASIEAGGLMDDVARARLGQVRAVLAEVDAAERTLIAEELAQAQVQARLEIENRHAEVTAQILQLASSTARTSDERRRIELDLLAIAQRRQTAELQAAIAAEKDAEKRAGLVALLERLPALFDAQAADVGRRNATPYEAWREGRMTSPQAREWLDQKALDALDGVNAGLRDAWRNADGAGDALRRMGDVAVDALSRVADGLMEIAIQRLLIQPLGDALFGGGAGGGGSGGGLLGGFLGNLTGRIMGGQGAGTSAGLMQQPAPAGDGFGGLLQNWWSRPGRASGGLIGAAGLHRVGEFGPEMWDAPVGARVYDHEAARRIMMRAPGAVPMPAPGAAQPPTINMPVTVVNRTSEPASARVSQGPDGIEVILEPMVRGAVQKMGADGSLARASALAPRPIRR